MSRLKSAFLHNMMSVKEDLEEKTLMTRKSAGNGVVVRRKRKCVERKGKHPWHLPAGGERKEWVVGGRQIDLLPSFFSRGKKQKKIQTQLRN